MNANNTQNNLERALVETGVIIKLGLDVYAAKVAICVQIDGATPQPSQLVPSERVLGWISALRARHPGARVVSCYEAGPIGYVLHRQLVAAGIENLVVTPQRLDTDGRRQKTDRLDARALAERLDRYIRGNRHAMSIVRVPTPAQEQARSLVRMRSQLMRTRRKHEARGRGVMLAQGIRVQGAWWSPAKWEKLVPTLPGWLRPIVEVWQRMALEADAEERKVREKLEEAAPSQLPRGIGALTWVTISREILDWSRFKNRRQVASYTGLCPGISQSGERTHYGSVNRHGNPAIRHALIELVWRLALWQPQYPPVRCLVEKSLSPRLRRKAAVAAARRLAIDLWRLATGQTTPENVGLTAPYAPRTS
jgi:transposase